MRKLDVKLTQIRFSHTVYLGYHLVEGEAVIEVLRPEPSVSQGLSSPQCLAESGSKFLEQKP